MKLPLDGLFIHPLKSCAPVRSVKLDVLLDGIADDRRIMVIDDQNRFLTAREVPDLLSIQCIPSSNGYVFLAPGMVAIEVNAQGVEDIRARIWMDEVEASLHVQTINQWLTTYLKRPAKLAAMTPKTQRPLRMTPGRSYTFADTGPVLLTCTASLNELNERLEEPVSMQRFRPNIVVRTETPWAEDRWQRIRIGKVEFDIGAACDRCVMITIDPHTRQRSAQAEPLRTLATYRKIADQVCFGIYLVPCQPGTIFETDTIEILETKEPPPFVVSAAPRPRLLKAESLDGLGTPPAAAFPRLILECMGFTQESPTVRTFRFRSNPSYPFSYMPGQFINLTIPHPGGTLIRSYTLSSSPSRPHDISITVRREGKGSTWLHDHALPGLRLEATRPGGHFHFLARPGRKILLVGAGSGMTPMISIARWIVDCHVSSDVILHQSARSQDEVLFADELNLLSRQASMPFRASLNLTGTAADDMHSPFRGRLNKSMLRHICPDIEERIVFCCGPDGFRQKMRDLLAAIPDFAMNNYLEEAFGGAVQPQVEAEGAIIRRALTVSIPAMDLTIPTDNTHNLLEILRDAQVPILSGCQSGLCGACKCIIRSGRWALAANNVDPDMNVLSAEERSTGYVLACSCRPLENLTIEVLPL